MSDWIDNAKQPFGNSNAKKIEVRFHTGDVGVISCPGCHRPSHNLIKEWRPTEAAATERFQLDAMKHRARLAQQTASQNKDAEIERLIAETHRWSEAEKKTKAEHEEAMRAVTKHVLKLQTQLDEIETIGNLYWKDFRKDWADIMKKRDALPLPAEPPGSIVYSMLGVLCMTTLDLKNCCEFKDRVMELRMEQGESVEILCDNEEGPNAVVCSAEFTEWEEKRFEGKDVLECLQNACKARREWWFNQLVKLAEEKECQGAISNGIEEHMTGYLEGNSPRQELEEQISASQ